MDPTTYLNRRILTVAAHFRYHSHNKTLFHLYFYLPLMHQISFHHYTRNTLNRRLFRHARTFRVRIKISGSGKRTFGTFIYAIYSSICLHYRSRWQCRLRCGSSIARLLGSRVQIPLRAWTSVFFVLVVCCAGVGLWDELITCSEESNRLCG